MRPFAARSNPKAVSVSRQTGTERQRFPVEVDARGEDGVLERIHPLGELADDDAAVTRLAQPEQTLVSRRCLLLATQRVVLLSCEEIGVTGHDRRLFARLLLAHAHR